MNVYASGCRALVHVDRLVWNYNCLRRHLPAHVEIMPVLKANAYSHGDGWVAKTLTAAGAGRLAVSSLPEALSLRRWGITCPVLILVPAPQECADLMARENFTQTVPSMAYARLLREEAAQKGVRLTVHIKVDTGMSRLGFFPEQMDDIAEICSWPEFLAEGIYTHFASADEGTPDSTAYTQGQFRRFMELLTALEQRGITFALRHCCNSAGAICHPEMALDMVRPGLLLYGDSPGPGCDGILPLRPAMEWVAPLTAIKEIPAGTPVSYGRIFTAPGPLRIATLSAGYADGYGREQGATGGWVSVGGQRAPVVGRVCMDQLMVDITGIPQAAVGDLAVLGGGEGPSFAEMARRAGTVSYEKLCAVGRRVPRIYLENGREIATYCDN